MKLLEDNNPLLVAESSINAAGHMDIQFRHVDIVKETGWHVLKLQMKTIDYFYTPEELAKPKWSPFGSTYGDYVRQRYFSHDEFRIIYDYCREQGVAFSATPFDPPALERLMDFDPPYIKMASAKTVDKVMLRLACQTKKPLFISTGMCNYDTIIRVVDYIGEQGGDLQMIYHCTSSYPCEPKDLNLRVISRLRSRFNIPIGLSSHDTGILSAPMAVLLGAESIERHITVDRGIFGSDQRFSLEPDGMRRIARDVKAVTEMLGSEDKHVLPCEYDNMKRLKQRNDFA